jgi:DNA replication and repair protein RecF
VSAALSFQTQSPNGSPSAPRLAVSRISLNDFRCYGTLRIEPEPGLVVLTGANGAGKTNLLEALSLLSPGRGLRGARLAEISRRGAGGGWSVAAEFATPHGPLSVGVGWAEADGERRAVRIDGENARSQAALSEHVSMVWLTPAMDRLFVDAPADRRRFLDRLVFAFDPAHAGRLQAYDKARRERTRLLRDRRMDDSWLGALERNMAERAVAIAAARLDLVERLKTALEEETGAFPRPDIAVRGAVEDMLGDHPAVEVEDRYLAMLREARPIDTDSGSCEGVHRSDLFARLNAGGPDAAQASTGEQKAILIALILAHGRLLARLRGRVPVLLLDEISAHLDAGRRAQLFDAIGELGAQAWMTGTDEALFAPLRGRAQFYSVSQGTISPGAKHG